MSQVTSEAVISRALPSRSVTCKTRGASEPNILVDNPVDRSFTLSTGETFDDLIDITVTEGDLYGPAYQELYLDPAINGDPGAKETATTVHGLPAVLLETEGDLFPTAILWQERAGLSVFIATRRADPAWLVSVAEASF